MNSINIDIQTTPESIKAVITKVSSDGLQQRFSFDIDAKSKDTNVGVQTTIIASIINNCRFLCSICDDAQNIQLNQ
jgi:hypothetical protein